MSEAVTRNRIEDAIESLLQFLDELDGDTDLEPSLGATSSINQLLWGLSGDREDLEDEHDGREDDYRV